MVVGVTGSDASLMAEAQAGDAGAFGEIYDRYAARAYGLARSVCRDTGAAEEAVQEAFLSAWRARATYRAGPAGVAPWLLTVVRRRAIDVLRRDQQHRADARSAPVAAAVSSVADGAEADEERGDMRVALMALPEPQREVITLAFYGELTHREIADHLDLPQGTVKGRMRLGLQKLADAEAAG